MPTPALLNSESNFRRKLALHVQEATKPKRITAQEILDPGDVQELTLEDAVQRAQALWMAGYTWDEIEARLTDMEFSPDIAKKAVKKTQEYAKEMLNNGPFEAPLVEGQTARLKNGSIVIVQAVSPENFTVQDGDETYTVTIKQIDREASLDLKEAYLMRMAAKRMVKDAQKYKTPEMEEGYKLPEAPEKPQMTYSPKIEETFTFKPYKKTPSELTERTPEAGEVPEFSDQLKSVINNLMGLEEMKDEIEKEKKELNDKLAPLRKNITDLNADQQAELRNAFLILDNMTEGIKVLNNTVFGSYLGQNVALETKVIEAEKEPGVIEDLNFIKEILSKNHPKIYKQVLDALTVYHEANKTIDRRVERTLMTYTYREKPLKKKESLGVDAQLLEKVKKFFKSIVTKVKMVTNRLFDKTIPLAEETTNALKAFNKKASIASSNVRVKAAIESLRRR